MIYLMGDIHGTLEVYKVTDYFKRKVVIPEELPNSKEYTRGINELDKNNNRVHFILTYTAPYDIAVEMGVDVYTEEEELQYYLQQIVDNVDFKYWLFGHYHRDVVIEKKYRGLYDKVAKIDYRKFGIIK